MRRWLSGLPSNRIIRTLIRKVEGDTPGLARYIQWCDSRVYGAGLCNCSGICLSLHYYQTLPYPVHLRTTTHSAFSWRGLFISRLSGSQAGPLRWSFWPLCLLHKSQNFRLCWKRWLGGCGRLFCNLKIPACQFCSHDGGMRNHPPCFVCMRANELSGSIWSSAAGTDNECDISVSHR